MKRNPTDTPTYTESDMRAAYEEGYTAAYLQAYEAVHRLAGELSRHHKAARDAAQQMIRAGHLGSVKR